MQVLFQKADGTRVPISEEAYNNMTHRYGSRISHIIRRRNLVVCCLRGNERAMPKAVKYGGGHRMSNPYEYIGAGA